MDSLLSSYKPVKFRLETETKSVLHKPYQVHTPQLSASNGHNLGISR
jgi:hypothetical protein